MKPSKINIKQFIKRQTYPEEETIIRIPEKWKCAFCGLYHKGEPSGKHQPKQDY